MEEEEEEEESFTEFSSTAGPLPLLCAATCRISALKS
jgi:hypothetical protein